MRMMLADPTGQIERECADKAFTQKSVALTYALALRDEPFVPVDWKRANEAIRKRWPAGLERVKKMAWGMKVPAAPGPGNEQETTSWKRSRRDGSATSGSTT